MKSGTHAVVGYVFAVLAASATFTAGSIVYGYFFGGALSAVYPLSTRMTQLFTMSLLVFLVTTFLTFFTAFLPTIAVHKVAERYSIHHVIYYLVCGALTGVSLGLVVILFTPRMYSAPPVEPPLYEQLLYFSRYSVPAGLVGGLVYWWLIGRFLKRSESIAA